MNRVHFSFVCYLPKNSHTAQVTLLLIPDLLLVGAEEISQ